MKQQIRTMLMREQKRAKQELAHAEAFKHKMQDLGIWEEVKEKLIKEQLELLTNKSKCTKK